MQNQKFIRFGHREDDKAIPEPKMSLSNGFFLDLGTFLKGLRWKSVERKNYYSLETKDGC